MGVDVYRRKRTPLKSWSGSMVAPVTSRSFSEPRGCDFRPSMPLRSDWPTRAAFTWQYAIPLSGPRSTWRPAPSCKNSSMSDAQRRRKSLPFGQHSSCWSCCTSSTPQKTVPLRQSVHSRTARSTWSNFWKKCATALSNCGFNHHLRPTRPKDGFMMRLPTLATRPLNRG
ncbi:hypothetical protein D9M71_517070 [compost metagenome]